MSLPLMGGPNSKVPPGCRSESDKCSDDGVGDRGGVGEASNSPDGADIGEPSDSADGILSECDGDDDLVRSGLLEKESRPLIVLRIDSNRRFESDECSDDGLEDGGAASGEASDSPDGADIGELSNSPNGIPSERNGDDDLERVLLLVEKESRPLILLRIDSKFCFGIAYEAIARIGSRLPAARALEQYTYMYICQIQSMLFITVCPTCVLLTVELLIMHSGVGNSCWNGDVNIPEANRISIS